MPENGSAGERQKIVARFLELWFRDKLSLVLVLLGVIAGVADIGTNIERLADKIIQLLRSIFGEAKAAGAITTMGANSASESGELLNTLFTVGCFVAFFLVFIVSIHNNSSAKRQVEKAHANLFA
jgi:hypothetical protein